MPQKILTSRLPDRFAAALLISLAASSAAMANIAPGPQYLYFNANCADCALAANSDYFNVVATFELDGYNYGDPLVNGSFLQNGNIVSFSYSGSNLVNPFQVLAQRAGEKSPPNGFKSISGQINTGQDWPAPTDGYLDITFSNLNGSDQRFTISTSGDWSYYAGSPLPNDYGTGTWSLTAGPVGAQVQQVPEPGALVLLGLGLAALGFARVSLRSKNLAAINNQELPLRFLSYPLLIGLLPGCKQ